MIELFLGMKIKGDSAFPFSELNFSPSFPALFEVSFGSQDVRVLAWSRWLGRLLKTLDPSLGIPDGKAQFDDLLSQN